MFKFHKKDRWGKKLQDGKSAHLADHQRWSRRQFLSHTGLATGALIGGASSLSWASPFLADLYNQDNDNDRVLILIRLAGGNDGLNTIVPSGINPRRQVYQTLRGSLVRDEIDLSNLQTTVGNISTDSEFGVPEQLAEIHDMWMNGKMAVIHNVGCRNQGGSHFNGSDIWASGAENIQSANDLRKYSGWVGRYFNETLPAFLDTPLPVPPAIQIGRSNNLMFRGKNGAPHDLVFTDLDAFDDLIADGVLYNSICPGITNPAMTERNFVRQVANSAYRYSEAIIAAWDHLDTQQDLENPAYPYPYEANPSSNLALRVDLGDKMKKIVRLIRGHLKTKIYLIELNGFDTHAGQKTRHNTLLTEVSKTVRAAYEELEASGNADRVMMMTMSEFGREVTQNSAGGTDHGSLAPMMLFGGGVNGKKFYGTPINLGADFVDADGKVYFDTQDGAIDFRTVYDTVLRDWLCADPQTTEKVLNYGVESNGAVNPYIVCNPPADSISTVCTDPLGGMIQGGCGAAVSESSNYETYIASQILFGYNVFKETDTVSGEDLTKIKFKYATKSAGNIQLKILNNDEERTPVLYDLLAEDGETMVATELDPVFTQYREANSYTHVFDPTGILVPNTKYVCQLAVNGMITEKILEIH